jgi:hypothetical protein
MRWLFPGHCDVGFAESGLGAHPQAGFPTPPVLVTSEDIQVGKPHPEPFCWGRSVWGCLRHSVSHLKTPCRADLSKEADVW